MITYLKWSSSISLIFLESLCHVTVGAGIPSAPQANLISDSVPETTEIVSSLAGLIKAGTKYTQQWLETK